MFKFLLTFCVLLPAHADELRIAVASNFAAPMKEIIQSFEANTQHKVLMSTGSSGQFYAQILNAAPFDLFFSADKERVAKLTKKAICVYDSMKIYAIGRLALYSAIHPVEQSSLMTISGKKVAMANAKLAPYGKAASEVINKHALNIKPIIGANISQSFHFAYSKNVAYAFVAMSQLKDIDKKHYYLIPSNEHSPIEQAVAIVSKSKNKKLAYEFLSFLSDKKAVSIIKKFGYDIP